MSNVQCLVIRVFDWLLTCSKVKDFLVSDRVHFEEYINSYTYGELLVECDDAFIAGRRVQFLEMYCWWWERVIHDGYIYRIEYDSQKKLQKLLFRWFESKMLDFDTLSWWSISWSAKDGMQSIADDLQAYGVCMKIRVEGNPDVQYEYDRCINLYDVFDTIAEELLLFREVKLEKQPDWSTCYAVSFKECIWEDRTTIDDLYSIVYDGKYTLWNTISNILSYAWWSQSNVVIGRDESWKTSIKRRAWAEVKWIKCVDFSSEYTQEQLDEKTSNELEKLANEDFTVEIWIDKNLDVKVWDKIVVKIQNYKQQINWSYDVIVLRSITDYKHNQKETKAIVSNSRKTATRQSILQAIYW